MINRTLNLSNCNNSIFLFGPRQTGKTSLVSQQLKPDLNLNLLLDKEYHLYSQNPSHLSKEIETLKNPQLIVVDEIQRIPSLLNEIHYWIEKRPGLNFVMTGSSARTLRQKGVNLLGGRAFTFHLFPLTHLEIGELFSLEETLRFGTLPKFYLDQNRQNKIRGLKSYVETYLNEEIKQEAQLRNIPAFSKFLQLAAFENGNIINLKNMSREVGVSSHIIKGYFQILEDTLIGFYLSSFSKSHRKKILSHPKFYFFDPGIVSSLQQRLSVELVPSTRLYGDSFEHWVILELRRLLSYREREYEMSFFRTSDGAEVDLILETFEKRWAIEIKSGVSVPLKELKGLKSFMNDHSYDRAICVCQAPRAYQENGIEFLPWKEFFEQV